MTLIRNSMVIDNGISYEVGMLKGNGAIKYIIDKWTGDTLTIDEPFKKDYFVCPMYTCILCIIRCFSIIDIKEMLS